MTRGPVTDVDLYLDADGNVIPLGPDAAFLLVRAGKAIPDGYVQPQVEVEVVKQVKKPANKARKKPANK